VSTIDKEVVKKKKTVLQYAESTYFS